MTDVAAVRTSVRPASAIVRIAVVAGTALAVLFVAGLPTAALAQQTQKPPLHAQKWLAITGKPLAATAGSMMFQKGGNAVDAACAMLAATATMWDTLSWGGETQALIYDPHAKKVVAINALGVAPTGATAEFYRGLGLRYPPEYGPLAAVTPGTPGGLLLMLAEYGKLPLADVLGPAIEMADGYPIEAQAANTIERQKAWLKKWKYSREVMLPHLGEAREAPRAGEIFRQPDLAATLRKLVEAEKQALKSGKSRKAAIMAAYNRFYRGDIARELVRGVQEEGGLITLDDLAKWQPKIEAPRTTNYRGVDVYKLDVWTQGPALLQSLNILENFDLKSMGYNSARYVHTVYQAMNLAFADRDFWYGDPAFPPAEPVQGLLSKDYAKARAKLVRTDRNDPDVRPGDPWPYQNGTNPFPDLLANWRTVNPKPKSGPGSGGALTPESPSAAPKSIVPAHDRRASLDAVPSVRAAESLRAAALAEAGPSMTSLDAFRAGTTSVISADAEGWVVSITPSGGWIPATIAGRTGVGLSQRMQAFVTDPAEDPYNVVEPGKRPRVTLTPSLAMKDGRPLLAFAVQGGDSQDQNLLQFFLNVVEFGMTVQEATEAPNFNSFQMRSSFGEHESLPGRLELNDVTPPYVRSELRKMGYDLTFDDRTSGPINAIWFDQAHGTMWGGSSNHGEDYGIGW
jgi:gamma-glutamyltranspeptidase/glutathione hydrolase